MFVHVAALFLMTELNQAKERKLAMLCALMVQGIASYSQEAISIGERQSGRHQLA